MDEAGVVGRRRSRAEAEQLIREYEQSGLTRRAFCAGRGVSVHTLDAYRRKGREARLAVGGAIVPVELVDVPATVKSTQSQGMLCVALSNGLRIEVCAGFDAGELKRLIATVEAA